MRSETSKIGVVTGTDDATAQALFAAVAADWRQSGAAIVGLISEAHNLPDRTCSAGILRDIVSGKPFPIYLSTPPENTSCHLDAAGVEAACADILGQIAASDLVILSKFGKLEAQGQGLAAAFQAAAAAGKPILTTVSAKHRDAWDRFAAGADYLHSDRAELRSWWQTLASA
jgi:hypothetical protein